MNIGIIGQGFVGNAVYQKFKNYYSVYTYDLQAKLCNSTAEIINEKCKYIFVCLPTPMDKSGRCYTGIVEEVLTDLELLASMNQEKKIVVVKSTIPPGTTDNWNKEYKWIDIVFSPEFLTQRTAKLDMMTQARVIFGGDDIATGALEDFYSKRFKNRNYIHTDSTTAELIKYMNNTFFATKVSFMNEFKILANKLRVDWETAVWGFASDHRLGDSHLDVPGPDGKLGFGGTCFPKDINAIIDVANNNKVDMKVLKAAWKTNLEVRPEKDWEKLKGKAVV